MAEAPEQYKPVDQLTVADFDESALWEYVLDETIPGVDETWVRPLDRRIVPKHAYSILTRADFRLADGRRAVGFMSVRTEGEVTVDPGALVGPNDYIPLPGTSRIEAERDGYPWVLEERERLTQRVGGRDESVFPISYVLRVLISGEREYRTGVLE